MMSNIYSQIRQEMSDYVNNYIEIVEGYYFNTYYTIKRCHLYYNSQFQDKSKISGLDKIFYNISKLRAKVASKLLKFTPDDLVLVPTNNQSRLGAFILQQELKYWNKKHKIDRMFNAIRKNAPITGTAVFQKVKHDWDKGIVDIRRLAVDPTVDDIQDSRFVIYKYYLTTSDLRKMAKGNGWDMNAVERIIRRDKNKSTEAPVTYPMMNRNQKNIIRSSVYHEVYVRYGEVPEAWLKGKPEGSMDDDTCRSVFIVCNPNDLATNASNQQIEGGEVLYKSEWNKPWPFKEYHYDKTAGRWLGVGVIEDLFPAQERMNEMANQKRVAMLLSSMHIFQTSDPTIVQNILTDLESGDLIRKTPGSDGIQPVANEERNMQAWEWEETRYDKLANAVSFVNDVLLGEAGHRGVNTATGDALLNANSTSEFEDKRDEMVGVLKEYYREMVLPEAIKELSTDHVFRFCGTVEELNYFDNEYAKLRADELIYNGEVEVNNDQEKEQLIQTLVAKLKKKGKERFIEITKELYKNIDFDFDFITKQEQKSELALMQQSFQFLSAVAQNPMLLQNPMVKPLFYKINDLMGINPAEIEYMEQNNSLSPQNPAAQMNPEEMNNMMQEQEAQANKQIRPNQLTQ